MAAVSFFKFLGEDESSVTSMSNLKVNGDNKLDHGSQTKTDFWYK